MEKVINLLYDKQQNELMSLRFILVLSPTLSYHLSSKFPISKMVSTKIRCACILSYQSYMETTHAIRTLMGDVCEL